MKNNRGHWWLIRFIGLIVPQRLRLDWRQEWEAELAYRERLLAEWDKLDGRAKLDLGWRSLGAFWDALLLQPKRLEDEMFQDLRFGVRMLLKNPGFTLIAVITLALGIGANTAIFSVVNAVLLRPLPYPQAERIVRLWERNAAKDLPQFSVAVGNFNDWRQQTQTFEKMAAYREDGFSLQLGDAPRRVNGARVTADFFEVMGVQPSIGRVFTTPENAADGERAIILSHALWQQSFGGDAQLIGRQIRLDGQACQVVGVMPLGFRFPNDEAEVWLPYQFNAAQQQNRGAHYLRVLGRLKAGATLPQARVELDTIAQRLEQAFPDTNQGWRLFMLPLHEALSGELQTPLYVLLGAVLFVLLIACANVANLLLARHAAREREIAIRTALGAGHWRIVRQLLTESLLLAFAGSLGALFIAVWGVELLKKLGPRNIPRLQEAALDAPVLGFTLVVGVLTGLIFGLAPAWQRAQLNPNLALKDGARVTGGGQRLRQALVVAEIALSLLLLIGGGLMLKSFWRLQQVAPGFEAQGALTMELNLSPAKYAKPEQRAAYLQQVLDRLQALPGVTFAGATHRLPFRGNSAIGIQIEGRPASIPNQQPPVNYRAVTPDYFRAMGTPLIAGRTFTAEEGWQRPRAVIINQAFARQHWPNENPLGQRLRFNSADNPLLEIIGIAADTRESELTQEAQAALYVPYVANPWATMTVVLRTSGNPLSLAASVSAAVQQADPEQAVANLNTLEGLVSETVAQPRFNSTLMSLFAVLALVLAAVGIYGVIAYAVAQRTPELGLRMALGAQTRDVLLLVLKQGSQLALLGVTLGLGGAFAVTRYLKTLLYGVSVTDPLLFALTAAGLFLLALLACYIPARRATKVDPLVALRHD